MRSRIKQLRPLFYLALRFLEWVFWGGPVRRRLFSRVTLGYYNSLYRRSWRWTADKPPFFDQHVTTTRVALGRAEPFSLLRGFYSSEAIEPGDTVLDIGCGDGFFAARFFAPRAKEVHAIDIAPEAIRHAERWNAATNVDYLVRDVVADGLPSRAYDVVVWDGTLAHMTENQAQRVLTLIAETVGESGILVGSEGLNDISADHMQLFASADEVRALLAPHFHNVLLRTFSYPMVVGGGTRTEVFWRAANATERLKRIGWDSGA